MIDFSQVEHRRYLYQRLGIERTRLVLPEQEHGGKVEFVSLDNRNKKFFADALITQEREIALGVLTADCLSIFLYDTVRKAIGIVHAGWRSTKEEVLKNTVTNMQRRFSTMPSDLLVAFGPSIRVCCYKVNKDLQSYFPKHIQGRKEELFLDLKEANLEQLRSLGVRDENIFDCGMCTFCQNHEFFSYRKEGKDVGRIISLIMLM
ncbi:MAG: peptidoglycan editing factor PgeF [Candidatus Omnitrophica bacterium]|nr:peptidoglycan editing factor PgeF [Candidatus Omnitrophota bacterium]